MNKLDTCVYKNVPIGIYGSLEKPLFDVRELHRVLDKNTVDNFLKDNGDMYLTYTRLYELSFVVGDTEFKCWVECLLNNIMSRISQKQRTYEEIEKPEHLYVIKTDGGYKIGKTKLPLKKRMGALQTANCNDIHVVLDVPTCNADLTEKSVHFILDKYRCNSRREFFDCNIEYIKCVVTWCADMVNTMRSTFEHIPLEEFEERMRAISYLGKGDSVDLTYSISAPHGDPILDSEIIEVSENVREWVDKHVVHAPSHTMKLKDIYKKYYVHEVERVKSSKRERLRRDVEICIRERFPQFEECNGGEWRDLLLVDDSDFYMWMDEHVVPNDKGTLNLKGVLELYLGEVVPSRIATKYKLGIEHYIGVNYPYLTREYRDSSFNSQKVRGWVGVCLKSNDKGDFYEWLLDNVEYKDNELLDLNSICEAYFGKTDMHSSMKTKWRGEVERFIRDNYDTKWQYGVVNINGASYNGWKHLKLNLDNKESPCNDQSDQTMFEAWLDENLCYDKHCQRVLKLQECIKQYSGQQLSPRHLNKYRKYIDDYISDRYSESGFQYKQFWIGNQKYKGWLHFYINKESFYTWLKENIVYSENDILTLTEVCQSYLKKDTVHSRLSSKYKCDIERFIQTNYQNLDHKFDFIWTGEEKYRGWKHLKLKNEESADIDAFHSWLSNKIKYTENKILKLESICTSYLGKSVGPRTKTKFKAAVEEFIQKTFPLIPHKYQDSKVNDIKYKGWVHLTLV